MDIDNEFKDEEIYSTPQNNSPDEVQGNGVGLDEKPTMSKIWDPGSVVRLLELTWKGYNQQDDGKWVQDGKNAIARDEIIDLIINSIRNTVNSHNMIAKMQPEDVEVNLLEKIKEVIFLFHDEFSIDEDILETMVNQVDHINEIFMKGIVQGGQGAGTLTQVHAGLHQLTVESDKDKDFLSAMADRINRK